METKELLKRVRKIEIKSKGLSNHIFSGEYHSAFKGRGMSFSEVREYQYGDDIRNIDWNVTARFRSPYIKVFEEERELTVMLLVDVSDSSFFGTKGMMKNHLITELSAVLSFSAINNNDKVGMILFSDHIEKFIPPKKGKTHILRIISDLLTHEPSQNKTNIAEALGYFSNVMKKKTIAFLISDFIDSNYDKALDLASRKHDLIGVHVSDPMEEDLPNLGFVPLKDAETGTVNWVNTGAKSVRIKTKANYLKRLDECETAFRKAGADLMKIRTDKTYVQVLMNFFKKRMGV